MKIKSIAISLILSAFIFTGCATKSTTQDTGLKKITPQQENSKIESLYEKER
jgi:PBP1b-binding outer membrane lipoprotein LpoB